MSHRFYFGTPGRLAGLSRRVIGPSSRAAHAIAPDWTSGRLRRAMSRPPRPAPAPAGVPTARALATAHGELATYELGEGPVVLFSHGWSGRAAQMLPLMAETATRGYRAVAFDHYRHGTSGGADTNLPLFVRGARAVADDLAERGHPIVACATHSLGTAAVLHAGLVGVSRYFLVAPLIDLRALLHRRMSALGVHPALIDGAIEHCDREFGFDHRAIDPLRALPGGAEADVRIVHSLDDPIVPVLGSRELAASPAVRELLLLPGRSHARLMGVPVVRERFVRWLEGAPATSADPAAHEPERAHRAGRPAREALAPESP